MLCEKCGGEISSKWSEDDPRLHLCPRCLEAAGGEGCALCPAAPCHCHLEAEEEEDN
jgi:hypothetical protein